MAALHNFALKLLNLFCVLPSGFQAESPFLSFRARLGFHDVPAKQFAPYGCEGHARPGTIHLPFGCRGMDTFQVAKLHEAVLLPCRDEGLVVLRISMQLSLVPGLEFGKPNTHAARVLAMCFFRHLNHFSSDLERRLQVLEIVPQARLELPAANPIQQPFAKKPSSAKLGLKETFIIRHD